MEATDKEWFGYSKYCNQMKSGVHGSFAQSICEAWSAASPFNRVKLVEAFPEIFPTTYKYY